MTLYSLSENQKESPNENNNCDVNEEVNTRVSLFRGDMTCLEVDAIVNIVDSLAGGGICLLDLLLLLARIALGV